MGFQKKVMLFLILGLFLITFAHAQEIKFTAERGTQVNITETCSFNSLPCSSDFNCNITVEDPSQNILVLNEPMTRNNSVYNYSLTSTSPLPLGIYEVKDISCTNNVYNGSASFFFEITPSGSPPISSGEGFTLIGIIVILLVSVAVFLIFTIFINNPPVKIFFASISALMMIGTIGFGVTIMQQLFGTFGNIVSGYSLFYRLLSILLIGGSIGLIVYLVVIALKTFRKSRGLIDDD